MNMISGAKVPAPLMSERRVSLICALIVMIGPISLSLFTPAMPELVVAFGSTESVVKLTLSLYFAGFAVAQLVCGPLSDGFGRKPVTFVFMVIYLLSSVLAVYAPSIEALIAARFLQGVGAAVGTTVSRAVVRDLFTNERSARIMNLISLLMGVAPAFAPTLGGVMMGLFGWQSIFLFMAGAAVVIVATVHFAMVETVPRDLSRIRPRALARAYTTLLTDRYFMLSSVVLAGGLGAFYTQATILPFILMTRVGLTATEFGVSMLMQSASFFVGALLVRQLMVRFGAFRIVPVGFVGIVVGSLALPVLLGLYPPSVLTVMGPIVFYSFGTAFVMPAMSTASVAPFPHMAGAASSLAGFFQMGGGLVGSLVAAAIGEPVLAMATVIPCMGLIATAAYVVWRRVPEPALARVVLPGPGEGL